MTAKMMQFRSAIARLSGIVCGTERNCIILAVTSHTSPATARLARPVRVDFARRVCRSAIYRPGEDDRPAIFVELVPEWD